MFHFPAAGNKMEKWALNILISPDSKNKLTFQDNKLFDEIRGDSFELVENVPVLIAKSKQFIEQTDLHKYHNTDFNYLEHYQTDAELFDYFTEYECGASVFANNNLRETIIRKVPANSELLLDVGCGKGWVANYFIPKNKKIISLDISSVNPVKIDKMIHSINHLGLTADAFNLPLIDNSIDCIIASEIIEHVADPKLFISSLYKALKSGGKLIITTPYNEKLQYYLCVHCNKPTPRNAHIHSFNEQNFLKYIPDSADYQFTKTNNFYLEKLRMHIFLKYLPFPLWKIIDLLANKITKRPDKLVVEIVKR